MKFKITIRKIFALIISVALVISVFTVLVVSADDTDKMTTQEYYSSQAYLFTQLKDKKIDYPTYSERSKAVTDKYISDNTIIDDIGEHLGNGAKYASDKIGALGQKIGDTIDKYGNAAYDYLSSLGAGLLDGYTVQNQTPTVDLNGSGCLAVLEFNSGGAYRTVLYMYGDYGIVNFYPNDGRELCYQFSIRSNDNPSCYGIKYIYYNNDGSLFRVSEHFVDNHNKYIDFSQLGMPSGFISINYYGDWRNADNTPAETDDIYETITDYDFTHATDKELEDLINDLLNEFELKMPDLSTMEGLLNAIYARLGTLDSDNDNALLSQILAAIESLDKGSGSTENNDLKDVLEHLKDSLVYDDGENVVTISEQLKEIIDNQLTAEDFAIDETVYNQHSEVLKLRLLGKFSFIHNLSEFVTHIFDSYKNSSETLEISFDYGGKTHSVDFSYYNDFIPLVQCLFAAFIYITYGFHTYRKIPSYINGGDNE